MAQSISQKDDIAIIGMACRVAGADSPSKLWDILASSKNVQSEVTRFNSAGFYHPNGGARKGLTNVKHAYFMDEDIDRFDNAFFSIPPLEATAMDPQQRLLLEIAYEAIENAGIPLQDFRGTDTAVYTGIFGNDYASSLSRDLDATQKYQSTGTSNSIAANRISYFFDLHGPSLAVDTACSSTMVAMHQAILALQAKESSMALVAGSNLIISPDMFIHMSELGFLSPSGNCRSFDDSGDGYARAEGVLAIVLKPLSQALKDLDPVRAVIKGTRINQDGRTQGISLPSAEAQRSNLEALYKRYGLAPGDVQYLEAHGTGTAAGDPLELSAIDSVFGQSHVTEKLVVGSLKSNIGHLESCAALAGIIKTVECLERGLIPPQMHFEHPNPKIDFRHIKIPTCLTEWPPTKNGVRRAAVNSFGFGGTNGHAVLEHFPRGESSPCVAERPFLFKVSAMNDESLYALAKKCADYVKARNPPLHDLSYTLLSRRSNFKKTLFYTASTHTELVGKLMSDSSKALTQANEPIKKIGFLFTGQGAQWPQMGMQLFEQSPLFKDVLYECDRVLSTLPDGPSWSIISELSKPKEISQVYKSNYSQPLCTALQLGLVKLWRSWGVIPAVAVGHSSGEIGAAFAAGYISLRDAIIIAYYRGLFLGTEAGSSIPGPKGSMCAVGLGQKDCEVLLGSYVGRVALAAVNSPSSCTLSGDEDAIEDIIHSCAQDGIFVRALRVDMAYHSHHMLPLAPRYEDALASAAIAPITSNRASGCEMFSSVTGSKLDPSECCPSYWKDNMVSTVRFTAALTAATGFHDLDALVELGPHPVLNGPANDTLAALGKPQVSCFMSCSRGKPGFISMLDTVGQMINRGLPVQTSNVNGLEKVEGRQCSHELGQVLTDVPGYSWDHSTSFWAESRVSYNARFREFPRHELLGARCASDSPIRPTWRNLSMLREVDWLRDLKKTGATILPPVVYIFMALEASRQIQITQQLEGQLVQLLNMRFEGVFSLSTFTSDDTVTESHLNLSRRTNEDQYDFEILFGTPALDDSWRCYCCGTFQFVKEPAESPWRSKDTADHDEKLVAYIESFGMSIPQEVDISTLNNDGAVGHFEGGSESHEKYHLGPLKFTSILDIPGKLLLGSDIPASYKLSSIDLLQVPVGNWKFGRGSFSIDIMRHGLTGGTSNVRIYDSHNKLMRVEGMHLEMDKELHRKAPLRSLFYYPRLLADITHLASSKDLTIGQVLELATHKWPMSDIGVVALELCDYEAIAAQLAGMKEHDRSRFRSLNVLGMEAMVTTSDRVRVFQEFCEGMTFHVLFGSVSTAISLISRVRPGGLACVFLENRDDRLIFDEVFVLVCVVKGFQGGDWLLGRPKAPGNGNASSRELKVLSTPTFDTSLLCTLQDFDHVLLDRQDIDSTSQELQHLKAGFDAIVMDCGQDSMLASWPGVDLLPWIQAILEKGSNLLWVTDQKSANPFNNLANSFIRTVKSEHPSTRMANLHFEDNNDVGFFTKSVSDVYKAMRGGLEEIELVARDNQIHVLRYQPDDELSASIGIAPPTPSRFSLNSMRYRLSLAGRNKVVLLSERSNNNHNPEPKVVRVAIEASVVDGMGAAEVAGKTDDRRPTDDLGYFFAGRVVSDNDPEFPLMTRVVGSYPGAHASQLEVPTTHIRRVVKCQESAATAAAHYAAYATALIILERVARVRPGDALEVCIHGILGEALRRVCCSLGARLESGLPSSRDFILTFNKLDGILLNGRPISIRSHLATINQRDFMDSALAYQPRFATPIDVFELPDYKKAFEIAEAAPISTVTVHTGLDRVTGSIMCYRPSKQILRPDGVYVILGGLGGLGRYLSKWMINNGAKNLVAFSRRGLASDEARQALTEVESLGGRCDVLKVDASDSKSLESALCSVREAFTIRGVINMAMVLDDAPFVKMSGSQWDRALRVKVDSTWNLHQSTLLDPLDFFIMFSSISSVAGNRTQANYASGNAFQNAMAKYRRSIGQTGIAIALGAVSGVGVLANNLDLLRTLSQSGLSQLKPRDLDKIMEAAIIESNYTERSVLCTGLEMFETLDGTIQSKSKQNQVFWAEYPEFGFLLDHRFSSDGLAKDISLRDQLANAQGEAAHCILLGAFLGCLSNILGYEVAALDPTSPIAIYGLDSLNAVACRYWFFKQLAVDVPVFDVLGCKSINELVSRILEKLRELLGPSTATNVPQPHHNKDLAVRPLSHSQRRLWFLHQFITDKTVYNLLLICYIEGVLYTDIFAEAWSIFVQRHEILHSKLVDTADGLQQIPTTDARFPLQVVESSDLTFQDDVDALTATARSHIFDLEAGELVRGWLVIAPSESRFLLASHHIAWDRASVPTVFHETSTIYKSLIAGKDGQIELSSPYQFIDYTLWQESRLATSDLMKPHLDYWTAQLDGIPEAVSLLPMASMDRRPAMKQHVVDCVILQIEYTLTQRIKKFCKKMAVTPFMFIASAVSALVNRLTDDRDIVIGIPDGDRGHSEFDELVGFTVNMLAIRSKIDRQMSFVDHLENYRNACLEAYKHRLIPFDFLLQQLEVPRRTSHSPVFQITVNYQVQGSFPQYDYGGFQFTRYDHYNARTQSDFGLDVEETAEGELHCVFQYDTSLYSAEVVEDLANKFRQLCEDVVERDGNTTIEDIIISSTADQNFITAQLQPSYEVDKRLDKFNKDLFPALYHKAINSFPSKLALVDESSTLTYAELGLMTDHIANRLIKDGAKVGDRIGIFCEQGIDMVVAMYATIAAGCTYVPIDPDSPDERMSSMIEDTELERVLTDEICYQKASRVVACGISPSRIYQIKKTVASDASTCKPTLSRELTFEDAFCCIFTSGSTGRPKGIPIGHGSLRYQMQGFNECLDVCTEDRTLLSSAMVFDLSLPAIYGTILYGSTMIIASREARYSPTRMIDYVVDQRVTHCIFTPTQAKVLLTSRNSGKLSQWNSLRTMVLGGEQIPSWLVRDIYSLGLPDVVLLNGYAPAETTVVNSLKKLVLEDANRSIIPVGSPLWPARFHILDDSMKTLPIGIPGELFIGGPTVNVGYMKRDDITAKAFVKDPFASSYEIEKGFGRLYRTGDLFRLSADGTIHSLGRIGGDRQVKIRGMRTELGEIENAIWDVGQDVGESSSSKLSLVAVIYYKDEATTDGGLLTAYLTTVSGTKPNLDEQNAVSAYLRVGLREILPGHMLPNAFVFLTDLPRTSTGKTDYNALSAFPPPKQSSRMVDGLSTADVELSPAQSLIASVWKDVLTINGSLIPSDDFFALGGHSLVLMHIQSGIEHRCGVTVSLGELFANPTVSGMASLLLASASSQRNHRPTINGISNGSSDELKEHMNGYSNSHGTEPYVDWAKEGSLPADSDWYCDRGSVRPSSSIAMTGACTIVGAHFLYLMLTTTSANIDCIGVDSDSDENARSQVLSALHHWDLARYIPSTAYERVRVYNGRLSHPTLGLSPIQVLHLDKTIDSIYHFESEVSLLKNYEAIRAGNVDALHFLISLAHGKVGNTKSLHYLSTWGVPHLQAWEKTQLSTFTWEIREKEMTNMVPGANGTLAYLKCRWACESLLYQAGRRGLPVNIFRSCMCAGSPKSGIALDRTDINRRILEGSLQTGLVPDFSSDRGGGMSWITADFLVTSIKHLSQRHSHHSREARIYHIVSDTHIRYDALPQVLGNSYEGRELRSVSPDEWFAALRASGNVEMSMQAEVLDKWCEAGWIPFAIDATDTLRVLREEYGLVSLKVDRELLLKLAVGQEGF